MLPKVSVVIPCYNVEDYIEECLAAIFAQDYPDLEVIAVDNNSKDRTLELLREAEGRYANLVVLEEKRQGAPAARNKGLEQAKGEWIQFLDADDLLEPQKISHQIGLQPSDKVDFIAAAFLKIYIDGRKIKALIPNQHLWVNLVSGKLGITSANLFRKSALIAVGGWNEEMKSSQEADLMFRLIKRGGQAIIDNVDNTIIRQRSSGQISDQSVDNKVRYIELRLKMLDYFRQQDAAFVREHCDAFYQTIYNRVLLIAQQDVNLAKQYYNQIPAEFRPARWQARLYKNLVDLLGFESKLLKR